MKDKLPYALLVFFILITLGGIFIGEVSKVIETAIAVCLGCMGIG